MNISGISSVNKFNQNFGAFVAWKNNSDDDLNDDEISLLTNLRAVLDNKQSKHINIYGEIARGSEDEPDVKLVRFTTSPLQEDILEIRKQPKHANAQAKMYERYSPWFPLDRNLLWEAIQYTNRQISYIRYCTKDPDHRSGRIIRKH